MPIILFILALAVIISAIAFLIGLVKIIIAHNEEDKQSGIKLITYSVIVFIIGFGSCAALLNFSGI